MGNSEEKELEPTLTHLDEIEDTSIIATVNNGPSEQQNEDITNENSILHMYGTIPNYNDHIPKTKDNEIINIIGESEKYILNKLGNNYVVSWPYVSSDPVREYQSDNFLFERAFPWLFPGGIGGYLSIPLPRPNINIWMERMMRYYDGRFATDPPMVFFCIELYGKKSK